MQKKLKITIKIGVHSHTSKQSRWINNSNTINDYIQLYAISISANSDFHPIIFLLLYYETVFIHFPNSATYNTMYWICEHGIMLWMKNRVEWESYKICLPTITSIVVHWLLLLLLFVSTVFHFFHGNMHGILHIIDVIIWLLEIIVPPLILFVLSFYRYVYKLLCLSLSLFLASIGIWLMSSITMHKPVPRNYSSAKKTPPIHLTNQRI